MKTIKKYYTQDIWELTDDMCEHNSGEIIVVQGLAMTPAQILDRFQAGTTFKVAPPSYSPDPEDLDQEDLGQLKHMELFDLHQRGEILREHLEELEQQISEAEKASLKAIADAEKKASDEALKAQPQEGVEPAQKTT